MTGSFTVNGAARHIPSGRIVRVIELEESSAIVETPSFQQYRVEFCKLAVVDIDALELSVEFENVVHGQRWGGWNEEPAEETAQSQIV
jgi:hypothetical protein